MFHFTKGVYVLGIWVLQVSKGGVVALCEYREAQWVATFTASFIDDNGKVDKQNYEFRMDDETAADSARALVDGIVLKFPGATREQMEYIPINEDGFQWFKRNCVADTLPKYFDIIERDKALEILAQDNEGG